MAKYQMTGITKVALVLVLIGGGTFGIRYYLQNHGTAKMVSAVPEAQQQLVDVDEAEIQAKPASVPAGLPSETAVSTGKPATIHVIPWNAQMGLALANGGPKTTKGSLMEKHGINLTIERQDDYSKLQEEQIACANQLKGGAKRCTKGVEFVTIMGDAGPAFFAGLNGQLEKLGPEYKAEIVGVFGRSNGEDAFMAPQRVKDEPKQARGLLISGVLKDGDWNLAMFWAAQNEICNNPDPTTFDPNCLNWVGTGTAVEAAEKYVQGYCEERPVVANGKRTGEKRNVCVEATVVWTPTDVTVAKKKGGLVRIISTKENASQMPCTLIGIKKFNRENPDIVKGILAAAFEGAEQVRTGGTAALKRAAEASQKIYKEETPAYWQKYYKGVEEEDAQGNLVQLGGSRVFTLADNVRYFGLEQGAANAYEATYTLFGNIAKQQYPADLPSYPPVQDILNVSFINELVSEGGNQGTVDAPTFVESPTISEVIANRSWHINFQTGSAQFDKSAERELDDLLATLLVASNAAVELNGFTDNVGNPQSNQRLSEARAAAVKQYLERKASGNFPKNRVKVAGFGQERPVANNDTPAGRAKNRRVEVVLKAVQ